MYFSRTLPPIAFAFLLLATPDARALNLAVVGGMNYSHPSLDPDVPEGSSLSTKGAFDFGALVDIPLVSNYAFETGLIRHTRSTVLTDATSSSESTYSGWLVPLTFRFMRAKFFGLGFGPWIEALSQRTNEKTVYPDGGVVSISETDSNRKNWDMGFSADLRIEIPVYHDASLILNGAYLFGVTNIDSTGVSETRSQEMLFLFGLKIPIGTPVPFEEAHAPKLSEAEEEPASTPSPFPSPSPTAKKSIFKKSKHKKKKDIHND